jgi:pimeloyl-ACP methyl ester carboxylesterase
MQPRSRRVPGTDGVSLHLLEWSETGVPLLLLHGFGNEAHIWDDFAPAVAPYYRSGSSGWC